MSPFTLMMFLFHGRVVMPRFASDAHFGSEHVLLAQERIKADMEYFTITPSGVVHMVPGILGIALRMAVFS